MACVTSDCTKCEWWDSGIAKVCPDCGGVCVIEFDEWQDHDE